MVFRRTSRRCQHQQTTPIELMAFEPCGTVPTFHSITSLFTSGYFFLFDSVHGIRTFLAKGRQVHPGLGGGALVLKFFPFR